jgi:tRNA(Ile)-lysidine synthase
MDVLRQAGYPLIVAHFNHQLREGSDAEAAAVGQAAARLGIPSVVGGADVRAHAEKNKLSIEDAARTLRYRFLFEQAHAHGAQAVAVGHTADDQVETVLMHFLRGAGLTGLRGMMYRTILPAFDSILPVVRPLLDVWREETVVYCAGQGFHPQYDPSNESLNFLRNRIRHLLIPNLETYNPKFREAVWRTAQLLSADQAIVADSVDAAWKHSVVTESPGLIVFDASLLFAFAAGLQRYLLLHAFMRINPASDINFAALERVVSHLADPTRGASTTVSGGIRIFREAGQVFVAGEETVLPFERWPQLPAATDSIPLDAPGQAALSGEWRFHCEKWNIPALAREQMQENEDPFQVWLDAEKLTGGLHLRIRREGDKFQPLGLDGHTQKLSDLFTNVKLPQRARDRWPLLCAGDEILWVPGYQPSHAARLTKDSRQILYFSLLSSANKKTQ